MVYFANCKPVFCDIDPKTFTIDLENVKKKVTPKAKAIAPVHLFGNACDINEIVDFAEKYELRIIWDAAQAHGTKYKGKDVGGYDDVVCYSFYPTKNMTTGEGGMITTNDEEYCEKCKLLRNHGQTEKYYHPILGFNYRMTEIEAAIGLKQLEKLEHFIKKRRKNAKYLTNHLAEIDGIQPPFVKRGVKHSYHQYSVLIDPKQLGYTRDEFVKALRERGIETAIHYPRPIHKQPAFEEKYGIQRLFVSEEISDKILSLPVHPEVREMDLERIVETIKTLVFKHP
jgi:perosamine synthetase